MSAAEEYLHEFFARQRALSVQATDAVASMAKSNTELIATAGNGAALAKQARALAIADLLQRGRGHGRDDTALA